MNIEYYYNKLKEVENKYENKFGKGSLERTLYFEPRHPDEEDFINAINKLNRAIETNAPLVQMSKEDWKKLIF